MIVYRLQDMGGNGPYDDKYFPCTINDNIKGMYDLHHSVGYPSWREDFSSLDIRYSRYKDYITGCPTIESVNHWFGEFLESIYKETTLRIYEIEVDTAIISDSEQQLIFKKDTIISQKVLTLDKLIHQYI